jgi:hypothetical protein
VILARKEHRLGPMAFAHTVALDIRPSQWWHRAMRLHGSPIEVSWGHRAGAR